MVLSSAGPETIGLHSSALFHSHSLAEKAVDEPIEVDGTQSQGRTVTELDELKAGDNAGE
jgi:hypothetical protein